MPKSGRFQKINNLKPKKQTRSLFKTGFYLPKPASTLGV